MPATNSCSRARSPVWLTITKFSPMNSTGLIFWESMQVICIVAVRNTATVWHFTRIIWKTNSMQSFVLNHKLIIFSICEVYLNYIYILYYSTSTACLFPKRPFVISHFWTKQNTIYKYINIYYMYKYIY